MHKKIQSISKNHLHLVSGGQGKVGVYFDSRPDNFDNRHNVISVEANAQTGKQSHVKFSGEYDFTTGEPKGKFFFEKKFD